MAELGKAARDGAGWHISLDNLAADLTGNRDNPDHGDRWRELNQTYVRRFGPEASTIEPPKEWEDTYGDT